jgi:hypothetical protein
MPPIRIVINLRVIGEPTLAGSASAGAAGLLGITTPRSAHAIRQVALVARRAASRLRHESMISFQR